MKKIGIMTMHRIYNYGSFMQAYGLKKVIESLGYNVEFADFHVEKPLIECEKNSNILLRKVRNLFNIISYLKRKKYEKSFCRIYDQSLNKYLGVVPERNYPYGKIDQLVIGSDEVFNCLQGYPVGYSKELFGANYNNISVISYAGCFGNVDIEELNKYGIKDEIAKMFSTFKAISVRDENSFNIIKNLTGIEPFVNLDPVLIYDYNKELIDNVKIKDYILVYAYASRLSNNEKKCIKRFAKANNKKIVSIGTYQDIADYNLAVNPFELFSYFKHADYVITDTFHGSIFSIRAHSKFCTIIRNGSIGNSNKLIDLLKRLNLLDRIANDCGNLIELYKKDINYEKTDLIIEHERKKTMEYLRENLI